MVHLGGLHDAIVLPQQFQAELDLAADAAGRGKVGVSLMLKA
jgi:hypothetical protein